MDGDQKIFKVKYNINHTLTCKTGGFIALRQNETSCKCDYQPSLKSMQRY